MKLPFRLAPPTDEPPLKVTVSPLLNGCPVCATVTWSLAFTVTEPPPPFACAAASVFARISKLLSAALATVKLPFRLAPPTDEPPLKVTVSPLLNGCPVCATVILLVLKAPELPPALSKEAGGAPRLTPTFMKIVFDVPTECTV